MRVRQRTHALRVVWAPSLARRLIRHRSLQALLAGVVVVAVAASLSAQSQALQQQRLDWGVVESALVVIERIEPGELVSGSVERRDMPRAAVPVAAASGDAAGPSIRAKVTLFPGEIVMSERITGVSGDVGSSLPAGTVALTVPVVRLVPLLSEGDLIDLWSIDTANLSSRRVAANVAVLAIAADQITIAVPDPMVGDLAAASLRPLTITLLG